MKLDSKKIKEGLVNFSTNTNVKIYYPGGDNLIRDALDLITRLTEENERLIGAVKQYEEERKYHFVMSRKLNADTVREMQERIESRCIKGGIYPVFVKRVIDQVAKELIDGTSNT